MSLSQYLQQINAQWNDKNGTALADYFSFRHSHVRNPNLYLEHPDSTVAMYVDEPINEIVSAHLRCLYYVAKGDFTQAYAEQNSVVQGFIKIFQLFKDENWLLSLMNTVCLDLRLLAARVDTSLNSSTVLSGTKPREALEKAAETLMTCFRICSSDNRASEFDTKKWGMLSLVNQLFKLYFRINKLHLMKPLIRAIHSSPLKDKFPLSQQITFKYYVGRKAMYDSDYTQANDYLTFAFQHCHKKSWKNKRLILIYLVPVKLLLGYLPTIKVLKKYDLLQLWEICEAVRSGNAKQLSAAMVTHQQFFIKCGIYLILERLKSVTYRNLFKKVYIVVKNPVITLEYLLIALRMMDSPDVELEEANCILANLIYEGKIKGYISHSHQKVVLSKTDAFPKLTTLVQ